MLIRRSSYVHLTPLGAGRVLIVHAISQLRLVVDEEVAAILDWFSEPREMPGQMPELRAAHPIDPDALAGCLASLMEGGVLTGLEPAAEQAETAAKLDQIHGRDPGEALDRLRLQARDGGDPYWAVAQKRSAADLGCRLERRMDVLLFGDCELQMEADFLRREAATRGTELKVAASFPDDLRLAAERAHQAILVGALRSRRLVAQGSPEDHGGDPAAVYIAEARQIIEGLRAVSDAPIVIDNLAEPTVQPLGMADRGVHGHRNRFRRVNLELEALAAEFSDVHVADVCAAINAEGSARLLDDDLVGFTHFGSRGWLLQRPQSELAAVHGLFPDTAPLAVQVGGDPYGREAIAARLHMDLLEVLAGTGRRKCVIVDLDGTLWPGVLAETGSPFAWTPEISGLYSYAGLWFGIHEALKALKRRGVLLACVSKNDEALVRELWRWPDHYPTDRLLTPDDFVAWRVNWTDKATNIRSIAEELGFAMDAFVFVDDHPVERERVRQELPEVKVLGEDLFAVRRALLTDPGLMVPRLTGESAARTDLVKAQLGRDRLKRSAADESGFLASLQVQCRFGVPADETEVERVRELLQRTTQFNTTGAVFSAGELARHAADGRLFVAHASDRFGDYGLVAACVVEDGEITALVMSCRVIGLGVEHRFLAHILDACAERWSEVFAHIVETSRNGPVRHLYADNGFALVGEVWRRALDARPAAAA